MKKTSRRDFGKQAGLALGALSFASVTTTLVEGQHRRKFEGDPITVGGGGGNKRNPRDRRKLPPPVPIYLDFNDAVYKVSGIFPKKVFKHSTATTYMKSLTVTINGVSFNLTSFLPGDGECHIKVDSTKGGDQDVDIWGDKPLRLQFHTGKYTKVGNVYKSTEADNYITKVVVDTPLGHFERKNLTPSDEVKIVTDWA